jgi:CHASE2 domain-containing sensor protein/class 3 adenylate cyclase
VHLFRRNRAVKLAAEHTSQQSARSLAVGSIAIASLTLSSLVAVVGQFGWLQPLELRAYDRLVRLLPDRGADPRLLIVGITEADLQALQRSTPSDRTVAQAIETLQRHEPAVIGLDLYRELPQKPGQAALSNQLAAANVIAITKLGDSAATQVLPPAAVPADRIGFNDLLIDPDGVIRRNLLFATVESVTYFSFSLRLAVHYLAQQGVVPRSSALDSTHLQLGDAVFVPLDRHAGGYQSDAEVGAGYQILLRYRGRSVARRVTLTQVLHNQLQPDWVRGKIVLIGTTAASSKDLFYTPYSAAARVDHQMPGVEIHAQMVSQILTAVQDDRSLLWFWSTWQELLWLWGWAIGGGSLAWCVRQPLILGLSSGCLLLFLFGSGFVVLTQQGWVPLVAPAIATLLTAGAVVAYRAQQAQQQQQMVMTLLGQNTSPEIAAALWNDRNRLLQSGKLPGQKLTATMLFTDIKGFSTLAENTSPEALLDWLNEYLEAMTLAIQNHQGIVNKFTGDGLLAVFGVPVPRSNAAEIAQDAERAVCCALEMGDRLNQLNQDWQQRGMSPLQMRVGIFTGAVVVGSLGGRHRMEYGVIGDSVNIAARLEGCLKDRQCDVCRVLIAQETLDYVRGRFEVESWGAMALKGKQRTVEVYRVLRQILPSHMADDTTDRAADRQNISKSKRKQK